MITTQLRNLLLAVVCIFAGVSAQAQFTGSADQYPTSGYEGSPIKFSLSEVATTLGTDAATLGAAIDEYVKAEAPATVLFAANGTEWTAAIEANNHGFWMALDGTPVGYGETSIWYCSPEVDEAFTMLTFNVGQMPEKMNAGDKGEATITLKFNDKQATFALTLNVIAKPVYDIPAPATIVEKDLNIVGMAEVNVEQFPRGGYENDPVKVTVSDLAEKLGIADTGVLTDDLEKLLYAVRYNDGEVESGGGMKQDTVTTTLPGGIGTAPGWWFTDVEDANGEKSGESACSFYNGSKFFMEAFKFDVTTNELTCNLGQMPNTLKAGEKYFVNVYIVYGDKAYRIRYNLTIKEQEQGQGLEGLFEAGSVTYNFEQEVIAYNWEKFDVDLNAIATALGCEPANLDYAMLDDTDNWGAKTAEGRGFWISAAGLVTSWGTNARICILPAEGTDLSKLMIGQMEGDVCVPGDEYTANLYFVYGDKYFKLTVIMKIKEKEKVEYNFESVATRTINVQGVPHAKDYPLEGPSYSISPEDVQALIGIPISEASLYAWLPDSVAAETGSNYTKNMATYGCDPKPGYWLSADGHATGWGNNARVGICIGDGSSSDLPEGQFSWFQMPDKNGVGDVVNAKLFLVNEETNKMITFNIIINFVETLVENETVGSENIALPVGEETSVEIDLTKAAEALGVTVDDLLNSSNYYLRGLTNAGVYGEANNCEEGLSFNPDGSYDGYGSIYFDIAKEGDKTMLTIGCNDPVAEDYSVDAQFCFQIDNKLYVFYAKLVSNAIYSGIDSIVTNNADAQIYDLTGRKVMKAQRGLYIQNGRKYLVK